MSITSLHRIEHKLMGAIEAANKNVKNILAKLVVTYKYWVDKLPFALWVIELLSVH